MTPLDPMLKELLGASVAVLGLIFMIVLWEMGRKMVHFLVWWWTRREW